MAIGAANNYPSLDDIAGLVRTFVNDDKKGATGTAGEGQILTNTSITTSRLMASAIRETYRDCRIMGDTVLVKDNYLLTLPPVNSSLGSGVMNPAVQVSIQNVGYFDGLMMWPNLVLPSDFYLPLEMWERQSGTNNPFGMMNQSSGALAPRNQTQTLGDWEYRSDGLWMNGATQERDIRLRYIAQMPNIILPSPHMDWTNTFVPIKDSQEAIADKISLRYARRLGGDVLADVQAQAKSSITALRQQVTRARQMINFERPAYGGGAAGAAGNPATFLY